MTIDNTTAQWVEVIDGYAVCPEGLILSRKRGKETVLRLCSPGRNGYPIVHLSHSGKIHTRKVHHLVASAFIGPRPSPKHQINHKNGIKTDNRVSNLEWVTPSENGLHSYRVLGNKAPCGEVHGSAKLTSGQVADIRARAATGETQRQIAARFGINQSTVSEIVSGKRWRSTMTGEVLA